MMRAIAAIFLLLVTAGALRADGKFFGRSLVEARPTIPFQRAVLKFDGREQVMLVESSLQGPLGTYGWVVPLPKKPSYVKAVNPAYVEESFRVVKPHIRHNRDLEPTWMVMAFLFGVVALTSGLRYRNKPLGLRILFFFLEAGGLLLLYAVLFPVFAQAKASAAGAMMEAAGRKGPNVESLGTIGSYEVSVVSGKEGKEILEWLKSRDLAVEDDALPVIGAYAKEGWCFLAAEIRKTETRPYPPHPLKAVFPSDRLIYPMRLTGLQDQPLRLELLVVSDKEAAIPGMRSWACDNNDLLIPVDVRSEQDKEIYSDWHSGLYAMAKGGAVWTYLRGEFQPAAMRKDFSVDWKPMTRAQVEVWEQAAAGREALNQGVLYFALASAVVGLVLSCWKSMTDRTFAIGALIACLFAVSGAARWFESVEKVEAVEVYRDRSW